MKKTKSRLDQFLNQIEANIHSRERFVKRTSRKNPLVSIDYSIFLDENHSFKMALFPLLREIIHQHNLRIYLVMVSWWGRRDKARWTGGALFNTLRQFQRKGLCEVFLSYQEGNLEPSSLCQWCHKKKIKIFYVDRYRLLTKKENETIVPEQAPGKAENVMKAIKLIEQRIKIEGVSPKKTLVIFLDDDYTQYHWINYFLLFAPWVLSFGKKSGDKEIDQALQGIKRVSFIKSGCPRIILPFEVQEKIVEGTMRPLDYLEVNREVIHLASAHQRFGSNREKTDMDELISVLRKIKKRGQIYTPRNRAHFLGDTLNKKLDSLWREYIYRGGRVTQRLEGIFRYLSRKNRYRWLRQFTYLLHGDQGAPLDSWQQFSLGGGYALEISLLMQAICDRAFQNHQVLNVIGLPHSHQRSKDLAIWNMLDSILLAFDLLRVLYRDLSVRDFLSLHKYEQNYPMLDRYGDVITHQPQHKGLQIYPPLKNLIIE